MTSCREGGPRQCLRWEEFLEHYHQRSNVETAIMTSKSKFRDDVRRRTETGMANEVYAKVLCHNIYCLIQRIYELGIALEFLPREAKRNSL